MDELVEKSRHLGKVLSERFIKIYTISDGNLPWCQWFRRKILAGIREPGRKVHLSAWFFDSHIYLQALPYVRE